MGKKKIKGVSRILALITLPTLFGFARISTFVVDEASMAQTSPETSTIPGDGSTSTAPAPLLLGLAGGIFSLLLIGLCFIILKSRPHDIQPRRDIEAAKLSPKDTVDPQILDNATPSQKYKVVKKLKKEATQDSAQFNSVEVCAICMEVLGDQDDVRQLNCTHVFHMNCIDCWFQKRHFDCPLCKSIFIPVGSDDLGDVD